MSAERIAVLGAGSWGTALAALLAEKGHSVRIWALEPEVASDLTEHRENRRFLPGIQVPSSLRATSVIAGALEGARVVVSVVPSQHVRGVLGAAAPHADPEALWVSASKGIETSTLKRMDEVFEEVLGPRIRSRFTVISGPSFAKEVALRHPTAVVVAGHSPDSTARAQEIFQTEGFRVYTNTDTIGVELGGALKNVVAIAAGVVAGLGYGHNTRAGLITRGLAEMRRLGVSQGARPSTFSGLAGMGDLVLTCTGELSRNRTVGYRLGTGESLTEVLAATDAVAEGIETTRATVALAREADVEMPIAEEVHRILAEGRDPSEAVRSLMLRDPKPEEWS